MVVGLRVELADDAHPGHGRAARRGHRHDDHGSADQLPSLGLRARDRLRGLRRRALSKRKRNKYIAQIVMGFGLLFLGMKLAEDATIPLKSSEMFSSMIAYFSTRPLAGVAGAAVATLIFQGSAPTIGFLIALSASGQHDPRRRDADGPWREHRHDDHADLHDRGGRRPKGGAWRWRMRCSSSPASRCCSGRSCTSSTISWRRSTRSPRAGSPTRTRSSTSLNAIVFLPFIGLLRARSISKHYTPKAEKEKFGPKYLDTRALETPGARVRQRPARVSPHGGHRQRYAQGFASRLSEGRSRSDRRSSRSATTRSTS